MHARKAIVHIGLHKTGSTTLQHGLAANRDILRAQGCFYPVGHLPHKQQHSDLALLLKLQEKRRYDAAWGAILRDFQQTGCHSLILSGEEFSTLAAADIGYVINSLVGMFTEIKVILYVRNLFKFALSLLAQYSKIGDDIVCLHAALSRIQTFSPTAVITNWEAAVGDASVTVECLDSLPVGGGVLDNFASFVGIDCFAQAHDLWENRSADVIASSLLSHLAFEFGLSEIIFYRAYFAEQNQRWTFARSENRYYDDMQAWVNHVDLSHSKLANYAAELRRRPLSPVPKGGIPDSTTSMDEYLMFLAGVLKRVTEMSQKKQWA